MSVSTTPVRRAWHPLVGATLVVLPAVAAVALALLTGPAPAGAGSAGAGLTAFLAMGAVAGFAVSGST